MPGNAPALLHVWPASPPGQLRKSGVVTEPSSRLSLLRWMQHCRAADQGVAIRPVEPHASRARSNFQVLDSPFFRVACRLRLLGCGLLVGCELMEQGARLVDTRQEVAFPG